MSAVNPLAGGVFGSTSDAEDADLRQLVEDVGRRSFDARVGQRGRPEKFDDALWRTLEETGLTRLTSTPDLGAGPAELAVVLRGLARHACAVPLAETDLLAAWLGSEAGVTLPDDGPLTVAIGDATIRDGHIHGTASDVPWTRAAGAVILAAKASDGLYVGLAHAADLQIVDGHDLAGEPRDVVGFDLPAERFHTVDASVHDELVRRGAWARCVQIIGALDAVAELCVTHTRERVQFGRALSKFQSVQHALAAMAGEIERARAAATLAVAAASDHGFAAAQTDYAVNVAKVVVGRAVGPVTTTAHQLHGAIGVTIEHELWLTSLRAQSWATEFGSTAHYAQRLGRMALAAGNDEEALLNLVMGKVEGSQHDSP
jgi:acyl-CoA dehydrogenase